MYFHTLGFRADLNNDGFLNTHELASWVLSKTREHINEAAEENEKAFQKVDVDFDGKATWFEFVSMFLEKQGFNRFVH